MNIYMEMLNLSHLGRLTLKLFRMIVYLAAFEVNCITLLAQLILPFPPFPVFAAPFCLSHFLSFFARIQHPCLLT